MRDRVEQQETCAIGPEVRPAAAVAPPISEGPGAMIVERRCAEQARRIRSLEARLSDRDRLVRHLRGRVTDRRLFGLWLESEVRKRDQQIEGLLAMVAERGASLERAEAELAAMRSSRSWRMVAFLGRQPARARRLVKAALGLPPRIARAVSRRTSTGATHAADAAGSIAAPATGRVSPPDGPIEEARDRNAILARIPPRSDPYAIWLQNNATSAAEAAGALDRLARRPSFCVIVPVHGVGAGDLRETLASVREQLYPERSVVLVGGTRALAASLSGGATVSTAGGDPVEALRTAVERCSDEYLVILERGARLAPDALIEFARAASRGDGPPDLIYADEDRIDAQGRRFGPRFRPDWSPELLLSCPAIGTAFAVRRSAVEAVGGIRPSFGAAWAYDLALRIAEHSGRIVRVPRLLVTVPEDRGADAPGDRWPASTIARASEALAESIRRRGIEARVSLPDWAARRGLAAFDLEFPDRGPRVAILIPTRDRLDLLRRCIDSVLERTTYRDFEIIIIDNGSEEPETLDYLGRLGPPCRVVRIEGQRGRFNYAAIHNAAVRMLDESVEFLVLLNNDTEVRSPEWLGQLVGYGRMPGVGAVGARLLYGDGRVQHAGVATDLFDGAPGHVFRGVPWWHVDDQGLDRVARNVGAVTGACLLIRRRTFLEVGGFDEGRFAVAFNDIDLCLRLGQRGLRCVYAPRAELLHFEGSSRGFENDPAEYDAFRDRWGGRADRFHHPALMQRDGRLTVSTRRIVGGDGGSGRPARVLVALGRLDGLGDSVFARNLIEGYRGRGRIVAEVHGLAEGTIGDRLREAGIAVTVEPDGGDATPSERARRLAERWSREAYDLVHAVGLGRFDAVHAARLCGLPSLWSVRQAADFRDEFGGLDDTSSRIALEAFADAYRVVFPAWGVRWPYQPVETRWNFEVVLEGGRPPVARPSGCRAGSASRLTYVIEHEERGVRDFLDRVAELVRLGRDLIVQLYGPAAALRAIVRTEAARSLGDRVRLLLQADDAADALAASDVFVNCSPRDLSPQTIALAHHHRRPVILADAPGIDEYITSDRSAILIDPADPQGARRAIARLLDDPDRRKTLAESLRSPSIDAMVATYERFAWEAIGVRRARNPADEVARLDVA